MTRLPSILSASFPSPAVGLSPSYVPRREASLPMLGDGTAPGKVDVDSEVCRGNHRGSGLDSNASSHRAPRGTPPSARWLLRSELSVPVSYTHLTLPNEE